MERLRLVSILCRVLVLAGWLVLSSGAGAEEKNHRQTISLDGIWELAEGRMDTVPNDFRARVPVPGLVDLAEPQFQEVGTEESWRYREAFWYRRNFRLEGEVPPLVRLKINKACYGMRVYLNGELVGEHLPSFTPAVFDVTSFIKGGTEENVLVIRVGAHRRALPPGIPNGGDFEKVRYIPGIYDSVQLILSGKPEILYVQAVPDLRHECVRLYVTLGPEKEAMDTVVECTIREARSGHVVAEQKSPIVHLTPGEKKEVELSVSIPECHLWTPEDPFLYEAVVSTSGDTTRFRFGMREFRFDPQTKMAVLNGRIYPLRGTNVCIYRFFEDPARGDLPWKEDWVRRLHQTFRMMHWNSARYCIGFPPEKWYDIADEVGLLIQDEFPIWYLSQWPKELGREELAREYAAWMRERWNHPSVVIWDAQNETRTEETGAAIRAVRHLDRSGRPWDNGWAAPQDPLDVFESHPYPFFNPKGKNQPSKFRLSQLAGKPKRPDVEGGLGGNPLLNSGDNPVIINEYGWLWLNRDGTPTTLSRANYEALLGPDASAEERRKFYAYTIAAMTEFWRAGRQVAGVMHFCGLGYSRPDGETSDNFVDLHNLILEPHFVRRVGDAFSPVIAILDFWNEEVAAGASIEVPVVLLNDRWQNWSGTVRLALVPENGFQDGAEKLAPVVAERSCRLEPVDRQTFIVPVRLPSQPGIFYIVAELTDDDGRPVRSIRRIEIRSP